MASSYQGYAGYDPERAKVDRARQMAELLQQGATDTSPKSFWEGAAQLGKAFIARGAMDKADKAESAYRDSQQKALDLFLSQNPFGASEASPASETPSTPSSRRQAWMDQRKPAAAPAEASVPNVAQMAETLAMTSAPPAMGASGNMQPPAPNMAQAPAMAPPPATAQPQGMSGKIASLSNVLMGNMPERAPQVPQAPQMDIGALVRQRYAMTGDMQGAIDYGQALQRQQIEDQRFADQTRYARGRDAVGDQRWNTTFDYQKERDQVGDTRWNTEFDYRKGRDEIGDTQWGQQLGESKRQFNETMGLNRLKMALEGATANGAPSEDMIQLEREFAKDWKSVQGNFSDIQNQWGRMQSMASRGDAAGDLALVVSFTKMLDPGSVAREGEVALTQKAASLYDQMQNLLPRLEKGDTLLPPETRKALLEAAGQMYNVYNDTFQRLAGDYKSTAEQYRMAPERVMMGYRPSPAAAEAAARAQHANAIPFGGTGEFPIDKFRNLQKPADDVSDLLEKYR
jgi:hypothetical protein